MVVQKFILNALQIALHLTNMLFEHQMATCGLWNIFAPFDTDQVTLSYMISFHSDLNLQNYKAVADINGCLSELLDTFASAL